MFKLFTAAMVMATVFTSANSIAQEDSLFPGQLSTKSLVRMSLWYEGLEKTIQNQEVKEVVITEELQRALSRGE